MTTVRITQSSELPVAVEEVFAKLTMNGVNAELSPLVKMTVPAEWADRPIFDWPVQERLFRSWILLFRILPIDLHSIYFRAITPGEGFSEESSSAVNKLWAHERRIVPIPGGCRITDTVEYESRVPLLGQLLKPVYALVFRLRHRHLRAIHAGSDS